MLQVSGEQKGPITVLRLEGNIDEDGVAELRMALVRCLREDHVNVVVNLEGVKFISYMGVGILIERLRQFRACTGDLKLAALNLYTKRLFRMVGVTCLFDIYDDEATAILMYQRAA